MWASAWCSSRIGVHVETATPTGKHDEGQPDGWPSTYWYVRRRPTLPHSPPCSTIGAERLSFRVRNGAGRFPLAMVTVTLWRCRAVNPHPCRQGQDSIPDRISGTAQWTRVPIGGPIGVAVCGQALGLLVQVSCTCCHASTSCLSTRWSSRGPYLDDPVGDLILKRASRLDAFSGYPCRT